MKKGLDRLAYRNIPIFLRERNYIAGDCETVRETIYSAGARKETKQWRRQSDGVY